MTRRSTGGLTRTRSSWSVFRLEVTPSRSGATRVTRSSSSRSYRRNSSNSLVDGQAGGPMGSVKRLTLTAIGVVAMATVALSAHHSFAMFEMDKEVEYSGVVTEWKWQNPHVHFTMHVKGASGVDPATVGTW